MSPSQVPAPESIDAVTSAAIDEAVGILGAGGVVAIPTETVYGLAADASNVDAVRRVFAIKGRPADHPLIVHIAAAERLWEWAERVPLAAAALAEACWPGPLTVIVPRRDGVLDAVTGGLPTVAVRVPAHPVAQALLERFGGGVAAPSANRFGRVSPTTAEHVRADLGDDVDLVLDGGPAAIGVESTIVDCAVDPPQILRPGGIPDEQIAELLHGVVGEASGPSRASGMLASHYAPRCRVELAETVDAAAAAVARLRSSGDTVDLLRADADPVTVARNLYSWLRDADSRGLDAVIAVLPPPVGLGHAIRDRLFKAAGQG